MEKVTRFSLMIGLLAVGSCVSNPMSEEDRNEQIIQTYFNEVWNRGHVDVLDELLSTAYINHTPSTPNPPKGAVGLKPIVLAIRKGFPDLHYEIKEIIATKDRVVARVVMTGTQSDTLFGIPPTGKRVEVNQINIEKIENGRIVEHWRVTDELAMMKQLGVVQ
ncbi:ester cyclase [Chryseolinea soli]|uniref:Ester cyclase n=1 Tax=Chryseolinea soli TaxID=2321403 RepID=A0A385SSH9_9BACT|nr:ester cyclase [Chryseolinea soli]AYB32955.1 ester cyclase [Chryseolinea soli]